MSDSSISNQQPTTPVLSSKDIAEELEKATDITIQEIQNDPKSAAELGATPKLQNEVINIEKELLDIIVKQLDQNSMSAEDAQKLVAEFLDLLPVKDQKDLLGKLKRLSEENPVVKGVYIEYLKPEEENETQRKLQLMSQHLHAGKIEEALSIAKGEGNA